MQNAQASERLTVKAASQTSDGLARIAGITLSALVAATFWTYAISFACQSLDYSADAGLLSAIAVAIIVFVSIAMAAIPASD